MQSFLLKYMLLLLVASAIAFPDRLPHHETVGGKLCTSNPDRLLDLSGNMAGISSTHHFMYRLENMESSQSESGGSY